MKKITYLLIASLVLTSFTDNNQLKNKNIIDKAMTPDSTKQYGYNRDFLKNIQTLLNSGTQTLR